ncbi:MAG: prefoldin subunit [Candidatus Hodarchaeales archaeon]
MVMRDIPAALQEQLKQFEIMRQQAAVLREQIQHFERSHAELKATLKAIEGKEEDELVYRQIGMVLFQDKAGKVQKDLAERIEISNLQITQFKRQEENLRKKLKDKEKELTTQISGYQGAV